MPWRPRSDGWAGARASPTDGIAEEEDDDRGIPPEGAWRDLDARAATYPADRRRRARRPGEPPAPVPSRLSRADGRVGPAGDRRARPRGCPRHPLRPADARDDR